MNKKINMLKVFSVISIHSYVLLGWRGPISGTLLVKQHLDDGCHFLGFHHAFGFCNARNRTHKIKEYR